MPLSSEIELNSPEMMKEYPVKFPKIWNHPDRAKLEEMVDLNISPTQISQWTRELCTARGLPEGQGSSVYISGPTVGYYKNWRQGFKKPENLVPLPEGAVARADKLERDASAKKEEAIEMLDLIISKAYQQIVSGERITLQNALQALQLRTQIEQGRTIEIKLSVEVETTLRALVEVVMKEIPGEYRKTIANSIRSHPLLQQAIEVGSTEVKTGGN